MLFNVGSQKEDGKESPDLLSPINAGSSSKIGANMLAKMGSALRDDYEEEYRKMIREEYEKDVKEKKLCAMIMGKGKHLQTRLFLKTKEEDDDD